MRRAINLLPGYTYMKRIAQGSKGITRSKQYRLTLPEELSGVIEDIADEEDTSVSDISRRFIKLGLLITHVQQQPNGTIIVREGNTEYELARG